MRRSFFLRLVTGERLAEVSLADRASNPSSRRLCSSTSWQLLLCVLIARSPNDEDHRVRALRHSITKLGGIGERPRRVEDYEQ